MSKNAAFQVPSGSQTTTVPMKTIRGIAQHIAQRFNPEQIILFGSYAYGRPTAESDVDLLVVMDKPVDEMETMVEIAKSLPILTFAWTSSFARGRHWSGERSSGIGFCAKLPKREKSCINEPTKDWVDKADANF